MHDVQPVKVVVKCVTGGLMHRTNDRQAPLVGERMQSALQFESGEGVKS